MVDLECYGRTIEVMGREARPESDQYHLVEDRKVHRYEVR